MKKLIVLFVSMFLISEMIFGMDHLSGTLDNVLDEVTDVLKSEDNEQNYLDSIWRSLYSTVSIHQLDSLEIKRLENVETPIKVISQQSSIVPSSISINVSKEVGEIPITSKLTDTGAKLYEIPISVYPGMNGLEPELALTYNSQLGNGVVGYGWTLSGLSAINRSVKNLYYDGIAKGLTKDKNDSFSLDGVRLIRINTYDSYILYQSEYGQIFAKGYLSGLQVAYFEVFYPNGNKGTYGYKTTSSSYLTYPLTSLSDLNGNTITYTYRFINRCYKLSAISYNGCSVEFGYIKRNDPITSYWGGEKLYQDELIETITCKIGSNVLGKYKLSYTYRTRVSLLTEIGYESQSKSFNPIQLYYGGGNEPYAVEKNSKQLTKYYSTDKFNGLKIIKGRFDNAIGEDGFIVLENKNPYYRFYKNKKTNYFRSQYNESDVVLLYTRLSQNLLPVVREFKTGIGFIDIICADLQGRRKESIIKINNICDFDLDRKNVDRVCFTVYEYDEFNDLNERYQRIFDFTTLHTDSDGHQSIIPKFYFAGDFTGNGKMEVLAITAHQPFGDSSQSSKCYIFDLEGKNVLYEGAVFPYIVEFMGQNQTDSKKSANLTDKVFAFDYDGDGKTDICHIGDTGANVYTFDANGSNITSRKLVSYVGLKKKDLENKEVLCGEFNGDGLCDLIVSPDNEIKDDKTWNLYNSLGKDGFEKSTFKGFKKESDEFSGYLIQDMNGDGMTDLIVYDNKGFDVRLADNNNLTYSCIYEYYPTENVIPIPVNLSYRNRFSHFLCLKNGTLTIYGFPRKNNKERLLTGMINSLGVIEKNEYHYINDRDVSGGFYTMGSNAQFPYINILESLPVVSSYSLFLNGEETEHYDLKYHNAVLHTQGHGFCGFERISNSNKRRQVTEKCYDPYNYGILKQLTTPASEVKSEYNVSVGNSKIALITLRKKTEKDLLRGVTIISDYTYDKYGLPISEIVNYAGDIRKETTYIYSSNSTPGNGYNLGFVTSETVKVTQAGRACTESMTIPAYSRRQPSVKIVKKDGNSVKETNYSYDAFGNIISETVKDYASTIKNVTKYEYDSFGRIIKVIDPKGLVKGFTYNSNGQLSKEVDYRGGSTIFEYDLFGREKKITYPDSTIKTTLWSWDVSCENAVYSCTESITNRPKSIVEYDGLNRVVRNKKTLINGSYAYIDQVYDDYGNLSKESSPYISGGSITWNKYVYDSYDRLKSIEEASGRKTTYSYTDLSISTKEDEIQTTRTYDVFGNLISVTDPGGTITYNLLPDGLLSSIDVPGSKSIVFKYDKYRRKIEVDDPSYGLIKFEYDQSGNIIKETDALGRITQRTFDSYHRLTKEDIGGLITTYSYNTNDELIKIDSSNGTSKTYTYDKYGRLSAFKEVGVDGTWLQKRYNYIKGLVSAITYSVQSNKTFKEIYTYSNGHLYEVKFQDKSIYKVTSQNAYGDATHINSLNASIVNSYNPFGFLISRNVVTPKGAVKKEEYQINHSKNTLAARKDNIRNYLEGFGYDNLNRLVSVNGLRDTYDAYGNVTSKNGIGNFKYDLSDHPYAISGMDVSTDGVSKATQSVTYASYKRPLSISENGYSATFIYNGNYERVKMEVTKNGNKVSKRYYLGGCYEYESTPTRTIEKIYPMGGYYDAPVVMVWDNKNSQLYAILRDHIGSITHILSSDGSIVQELSYDSWGRLRNCEDRKVYTYGAEPELLLGRGYTGHEHLPWFGLINMNARLYDPIISRFLSPDPMLQFPDNTQGYNRYTYAMNNPLCYVDKDGEMPVLLIAGLVGGVINLTSKALSGQIHNFGDGLAAFGVGAVAGMVGAFTGGVGYSLVGVGGFIGGAVGGLCGTMVSMPIESAGNSLFFHDPFLTPEEYVKGVAFGTMLGGAYSGAFAALQGRNVWTGEIVKAKCGNLAINNYTVELDENSLNSMAQSSPSSSKPKEWHHFATDKNKTYTPMIEKYTSKLGLDLNDPWNKELLPHRGRHPNLYHEWILRELKTIFSMPKMNEGNLSMKVDFFLKQFREQVINRVKDNPEMLYKKYWIENR